MTVAGEKCRSAAVGSVLIFTLWILVCLSLISVGFGHRVRLETKATGYTAASTQAFYIAQRAVYDKIIELMGYRETKDDNSDQGAGEKPDGQDTEIRYTVIGEEGKINVNLAPEDMLRNLKPIKGKIARAILKKRLGEDSKSDTEDDAAFRLPEEVLAVADIDTDEWYGEGKKERGIRELLTVYGDGLIDINSAPPEVLEAIPDVNRRVVEDIVAFRSGDDGILGTEDDKKWESASKMGEALDLAAGQLAPFKRYCKFGSDYYTITAAASKSGSRATARITVVANIMGETFEIVSWRED